MYITVLLYIGVLLVYYQCTISVLTDVKLGHSVPNYTLCLVSLAYLKPIWQIIAS